MTRIEDICANTLIADEKQIIFQDNWIKKLTIDCVDTGNSMTEMEMTVFLTTIDKDALFTTA